jgi:protein tyrosine phosphatase type 4A
MSLETVEQPREKTVKKSSAKEERSKTPPESGRMHNGGRVAGSTMAIGTEPTLIEVKQMRFLIMDAPRQGNLHLYIKKMRKNHVTDVVRVCEPTYLEDELTSAGISLHEMEYKDGTSPSKEIIDAWLQLVDNTFFQNPTENACIAVHCVAGLGRAPQMVAIALIEFANMDPVEAVSLLRERRRGAINLKQLLYLEGYKKQYKRGGDDPACCVIL